jgi:hypothetical protein
MLLVLLLAGCSTILADDAERKLRAQCEAEGKQFVLTKVEKNEGIVVSSAMVSGHCVGPGDPGYIPPVKATGA